MRAPSTPVVPDEGTYHTFFGDDDPAEEIDVGVEVIVDSVLEKHIAKMRAELIAEFTALLEPASKSKL